MTTSDPPDLEKTEDQFNHNTAWQFAEVARRYDQQRFSSLTGRIFNALEQRAIGHCLDIVEQHQPVRHVLDVPSGTGRISALLLKRGYDLTCGDISDQMLDVARVAVTGLGSGAREFARMDIYDLPCAPRTFDAVTCIRLFQHLTSDERARALTELARVSKRFVIVNAMYTSPYYGLVRRMRLALGRYAPRYTMSQIEMNREFAAAGLRRVEWVFPQPFYSGNVILLLAKEE